MKVILDANIWISYLLAPHQPRTITMAVERCWTGEIELFFPQELIREITETISASAYLRAHILPEDLDTLKTILTAGATALDKIESEIPSYSRDPEDDYLVAYAVTFDIDYLVTGDPDLLILEQVSHLKIVSPRAFLELLA